MLNDHIANFDDRNAFLQVLLALLGGSERLENPAQLFGADRQATGPVDLERLDALLGLLSYAKQIRETSLAVKKETREPTGLAMRKPTDAPRPGAYFV